MDFSPFTAEKPSQFDWQQELITIAKPMLDALKDLTEKSRKVDQLRTEITRLRGLLEQLEQAHGHLTALPLDTAPGKVKKSLKELTATWEQRTKETRDALEIANYQLDSLLDRRQSPMQAIGRVIGDFFRERAVTLSIAVLAMLLIGGLLRLVFYLILRMYRLRDPDRAKPRWIRLVNYGLWGATLLFVVLAAITVFYARNDFLLLSLTILLLVVLLLGMRNTLPRYIQEIRLLLDIGPVRRGERIIFQGIPFHVHSIGVYSILINPALFGRIRIPTNQLAQSISRPRATDPWFPCQSGDFVMLEGDRFAEVLRQTVDFVYLKVMGSPLQVPTAEFIASPMRNLSLEGFIVPVTFGVDYQHQAQCLTTIPDTLRADLRQAFSEAGLDEAMVDLMVEFKEAGANSLDYIIVAVMSGSAANQYFAIGRLIQKTSVASCNREGWVIPFNQLTVHRGEGF